MNWASWTLVGLGALEGTAAIARHAERTRLFDAAVKRATELQRPLVVVGDPDAGLHTRIVRAYGCGDVCVDLSGCPACPTALAADITKPLPFPDNSVVVFVSCVLEYVGDLEAAYRELLRVAGDPKNLFVVTVQPLTFTATLYPGAHWRGMAVDGRVAMTQVGTGRKLLYFAALGGLGYFAAKPVIAALSKPAEPVVAPPLTLLTPPSHGGG
jgi:hypothetical protein